MRRILCAATLAFAASLAPLQAATTFYDDRAAFDAAAGATRAVELPALGNIGTDPRDAGDLTFDSLSGAIFLGTFDATSIPGNDVAISDVESFDVLIDDGTRAFGFYLFQPTDGSGGTVDVCNAPCVPSEFSIEAFDAGGSLGLVNVVPPYPGTAFYGFVSDSVITRVRVIETVGTNDNEFFGGFRVDAVVPLPAGLPLLLGGLGALALIRRRA